MYLTIKILNFVFFLFCLIFSYYLFLIFYDSTRGVDFGRYIENVQYFSGFKNEVLDAQGSLYFYLLSKLLFFDTSFEYFIGNQIVNNAIQFFNFILFLVGLVGLFFIFKKLKYKTSLIIYSFSILLFFPPMLYFRLTMKPEVMAFALYPWVIYFLNKYFEIKNRKNILVSSIFLSVLLTLKASITGMVLVSLFIFYYKELIKVKSNMYFLITTSFLTSSSLFIIFLNTKRWLFAKPYLLDIAAMEKWNNTANLSFFKNIDFRNLLENPFKYLHSDSFISITLLDTFSDYFTLFWFNIEDSNLLAFNRMKFSENFLIQEYLPQYISILFTFSFYVLVVVLIIYRVETSKFLLLPFCGMLILILNSLGFPNKNFDPITGDLFKVHYYSFFLTISFFSLFLYLISSFKILRFFGFFLIPVFLLAIGFPKHLENEYEDKILERISESNICLVFEHNLNIKC